MDRISRFEQLRFGMFIHFGLFSMADEGEWTWLMDQKERENYPQRFASFNPVNLNWKDIVSMAKDAGCRYITLTSRHHDGFSLYDTRGLNDYDVMHTPYHRDIIKDFVEECRRQDIIPFLYHTTLDWQDPRFKNDFPAYQKYLRDSLKILCQNYGEIGGFWFDGNWSDREADWEEDALYAMIRSYQPNAILINNTGLSKRGERGNPYLDTLTFEQGQIDDTGVRDQGRHLAMEACQTMNHHWGCASNDLDYKTPRTLIEMLNTCRKQNANYLLNIGLSGDGSVPIMNRALLHEIGIWTKMASASFYSGTLSPLKGENGAYALNQDAYTDLYCPGIPLLGVKNVVEETGGLQPNMTWTGAKKEVKCIHWLDSGEELKYLQKDDRILLKATGFPYGRDLIVRIARIEWK